MSNYSSGVILCHCGIRLDANIINHITPPTDTGLLYQHVANCGHVAID